jgi:PAS domain S-box-containing protein
LWSEKVEQAMAITQERETSSVVLTAELLKIALQSSADSILIKDIHGTILIGSQRIADFYGCSVSDLPGVNAYDILPADVAAVVRERDRKLLVSGTPEMGEEVWDLGYEKRALLATRSPIRDVSGSIIAIITSYRNITPIKHAFSHFEQNQRRYLALAQTCLVGIFECNPFHQITYVNPEWERLTGLSMSEVEGENWMRFVAPDYLPLVQAMLDSQPSPVQHRRVDCMLQGRRDCMVELSVNHVSDGENFTVSYIGSIVDLTSRLSVEKQLRENSNRLRDLTRSVPAIIWQMGLDGKVVFASDHWEVVTGQRFDDVLGSNWERYIHPEDLGMVRGRLEAVLEKKTDMTSFEFRLKGRSDPWRWVYANCQQIHSPDGDLMGIAGHTIDITDRRRVEEELKYYNNQLELRVVDRTQELRLANQSLVQEIETRRHAEELLEAKRSEVAHFDRISAMGKLSGELAHELNQPLNAIQNYAAGLSMILSNLPESESASNILSQLKKEVARAARIIRRTREFLSTGKHQPESVNALELVSDTAAMLKGEARRRGITIAILDESNERLKNLQFMADPVRIQQVLVNLVLNAMEAISESESETKQVDVAIQNEGEFIAFAVSDSGCGVPESEQSRLFEAFFTTKATGLGMGLAISREIVQNHGGTLNYKPNQPHGSTFVVRLPVVSHID